MGTYPQDGDRGHLTISESVSIPIEVERTFSPMPGYVLVSLGSGPSVWAKADDIALTRTG